MLNEISQGMYSLWAVELSLRDFEQKMLSGRSTLLKVIKCNTKIAVS